MSYSIPSGVFSVYQGVADSFINDLGRSIQVVYPAKQTPCPNCVIDTMTKRSANVYKAGGPLLFQAGSICPYCDGQGYKLTENSDSITCRIYWTDKFGRGDPQSARYMPIDTQAAQKSGTLISLVAFLSDQPKLDRAEYILYSFQRFRRISAPMPYGLGGDRYCLSVWESIS